MNASAAQYQLLTVSLLIIELVGKADFSQSPGEISQLDFKSASSLLLVAWFQATQCLFFFISCIGIRWWIRSSANWLARTDWARPWWLCSLVVSTSPFIHASSPFSREEGWLPPPCSLPLAKGPEMPRFYLLGAHLLTHQPKRLELPSTGAEPWWAPCQLLTTCSPTTQQQRLHG